MGGVISQKTVAFNFIVSYGFAGTLVGAQVIKIDINNCVISRKNYKVAQSAFTFFNYAATYTVNFKAIVVQLNKVFGFHIQSGGV